MKKYIKYEKWDEKIFHVPTSIVSVQLRLSNIFEPETNGVSLKMKSIGDVDNHNDTLFVG